ncbi:MAG: NAD(P)/FAD-dependent oxidoreductase [Nitrospira sp.]|nr:NAD(P)/FAD-dependent oxidoreductase [Nitrospira sp.]
MSESQADICIVGAGAAGLSAAVFAGEVASSCPLTIVLLDGAKTLGAKILVSGGGRCNVTHKVVTPNDYFGNRRIIKNVLAAFPVENTIAWFTSMGVNLKREETGKLFPVTDKSRTVLNALLERCRERGVAIRPDHRVADIEHSPDTGFAIRHSQGTLHAKKVILATGGRSLPKSGSDGSGYELARRLGHQVTATVPALVPLVLDDQIFHKTLSGLSQEVELTTVVEGRTVDQRTGSLLWTHFGISGPVVMDASRFWTMAKERGETVHLYGNFLPHLTSEQVREWFMKQAQEHPRRSLIKTLALRLPERSAEAILASAGCDTHMASGQLPRKEREHLLAMLTKFPFPITQDRGWNYAEVTAGGVPLEEINYRTMESKLVPGLFLVGEILDCDGRIGGFNFQWAWATGFLSGQAAAGSRLRAEPREP